jgi:ArsR family transcriptional regulator
MFMQNHRLSQKGWYGMTGLQIEENENGGVLAGVSAEGDSCACRIVHVDAVQRVRASMPEGLAMDAMTELFKSFGDRTRLSILFALSREKLCVCDIAALVNMSQSAVSHQLRVLRGVRLVKYEKKGKSVYYSLDDDHVKRIFEIGLAHVEHTR